MLIGGLSNQDRCISYRLESDHNSYLTDIASDLAFSVIVWDFLELVMPLSVDELIMKSKDQRSRKRIHEALVSALSAVEADNGSSEAWWQVALSHIALDDHQNAVTALRKVVEIEPSADGAWAQLGRSLELLGFNEEFQDAYSEALDWNENNIQALGGMARIYQAENNNINNEAELAILARLDSLIILSSNQHSRLGYLHFRQEHYHEAIRYWLIGQGQTKDPSNWFNIGLAYNRPSISQDADAIDMWRLTLEHFPDYEPAKRSLENVLPRMLALAAEARAQGETLLPEDQWYEHYINPFELLNPSADFELHELDTKTLQKLKKALLLEIELEDGHVSWIPGVAIDKSRAIGICDELNDNVKREFHWRVFSHKPLLGFLSKGAHEYFLVDEISSPTDLLLLLSEGDGEFKEFLGLAFTPQFDRLMCRALDRKNLVVLECLLDGRRWVPAAIEDRCFVNARRMIERFIQPLSVLHATSETSKPTISQLTEALDDSSLFPILNLLPSFFEDLQNLAAREVRGIAINCVNQFNDTDLSRQVIELCRRFKFKSADLNHQIEDDIRQIEALIAEERRYEIDLTSGNNQWKITKKGVQLNSRFISADDVTTVRWGLQLTGQQNAPTYDFLVSFGADGVRPIIFNWTATKELEKNQKYFTNMIDAARNYVFPALIQNIERRLESRQSILIGPCIVNRDGVEFATKGWLRSKNHFVPWHCVEVSMSNGEVSVCDSTSTKTRVTFDNRETENAPVLSILAHLKKGRLK